MKSPKIIITGANGFIGSFLATYFHRKGFYVSAFVHHLPKEKSEGIRYVLFDLDGGIEEREFEGSDYLVHCAYVKYQKNNNANEINFSGTKRLLDVSRKFKLKKFVFLSSLSAHQDALSNYGKNKYRLETLFDLNSDLILKPGLVLGHGGLFQNIVGLIKNGRVIPLIAGGKQPLQTLHVGDLADAVSTALEKNISGKYALAEKAPITMKIFYQAIARRLNKKIVWVYFPYSLARFIFGIFSFLDVSLPVSKENLLGMKQSKIYNVSRAASLFQLRPRTYEQSLKELLR